jgi:2-polyprenyl-3-methyl-5-hydroxy-6-metoxy-1,4-benzoquinol methylase
LLQAIHQTAPISLKTKARLWLKRRMWPGTNWVSRDKSKVVQHFLTGTPESPVRTLDCGCGNAYFSYEAAIRHSTCLGITIHDWERQNCEEMRDYLGLSEDQIEFRSTRLDALAADPSQRGQFDQVLLLDVIEHIKDAHATFRQIHDLLDDNGLVYVSTPDRDWQATPTTSESPGSRTAGTSGTAILSSSSKPSSNNPASSRSTASGSERLARPSSRGSSTSCSAR